LKDSFQRLLGGLMAGETCPLEIGAFHVAPGLLEIALGLT
jgi:hypothetical protein